MGIGIFASTLNGRLVQSCLEARSSRILRVEILGGVEELQKDILRDFFRHAFDGSGADNFFDAGSCIDGR